MFDGWMFDGWMFDGWIFDDWLLDGSLKEQSLLTVLIDSNCSTVHLRTFDRDVPSRVVEGLNACCLGLS